MYDFHIVFPQFMECCMTGEYNLYSINRWSISLTLQIISLLRVIITGCVAFCGRFFTMPRETKPLSSVLFVLLLRSIT